MVAYQDNPYSSDVLLATAALTGNLPPGSSRQSISRPSYRPTQLQLGQLSRFADHRHPDGQHGRSTRRRLTAEEQAAEDVGGAAVGGSSLKKNLPEERSNNLTRDTNKECARTVDRITTFVTDLIINRDVSGTVPEPNFPEQGA